MNLFFKILLSGIITLSVLNCSQFSRNNLSTNTLTSIDSVKYFSRDKEFISIKMNLDTLRIVTTNQNIYYPLGKYNSIDSFDERFEKVLETQYAYGDTSLQLDTLYNLYYKKSKVKVFRDNEENRINIVSGDIADIEIKLTNGIEIGQSLSDIIHTYFTRLPKGYENIQIVIIESGLTGIWHYYFFKDNILESIYFDTDYQFKK